MENTESKWIKVSDRLPEEENIWCYIIPKEESFLSKISVPYIRIYRHVEMEYWKNLYTHWMPVILPEPPKE